MSSRQSHVDELSHTWPVVARGSAPRGAGGAAGAAAPAAPGSTPPKPCLRDARSTQAFARLRQGIDKFEIWDAKQCRRIVEHVNQDAVCATPPSKILSRGMPKERMKGYFPVGGHRGTLRLQRGSLSTAKAQGFLWGAACIGRTVSPSPVELPPTAPPTHKRGSFLIPQQQFRPRLTGSAPPRRFPAASVPPFWEELRTGEMQGGAPVRGCPPKAAVVCLCEEAQGWSWLVRGTIVHKCVEQRRGWSESSGRPEVVVYISSREGAVLRKSRPSPG